MYNLNDIITLQQLGFSNEQIMSLASAPTTQAPLAQPTPIQAQPQAPFHQVRPQPVAQASQIQPTQIQAPIAQPQPVAQAPIAQPQPVAQAPIAQAQPVAQAPQIQQTQPIGGNPNEFVQSLANLGAAINAQPQAPQPQGTPLTTEQATQLFQQYMLNGSTQGIELPPNADDVLAKRFMSLYGVDTSKEVNNG